jgi:hypothetical protein
MTLRSVKWCIGAVVLFLPALVLFAIPVTEQNIYFLERLSILVTVFAAILLPGLIFTAPIKWSRRIAFAAGTWFLLLVQWGVYFVVALSHVH